MIDAKRQVADAVSRGIDFLRRQPYEWKVTAVRTSIFRLFYQMLLPYLSVYVLALGATAMQLGIVNSIGMAVAGVLSPIMGWWIDRMGGKRIYLAGIGLLAVSWAIYALAQDWTIIIVAMLAYWLGYRASMASCAVICGNTLLPQDRVTAMSCCESLAAGVLGMAGPILGAFLITAFGGMTVSGIRPLFYISLAGTIATFILIQTQLSNKRWGGTSASGGLFKDLSQVFKGGQYRKRFIIIAAFTGLPMGMIIPFTQPFASDVKGADQFVLGAMVTGFSLIPLVFGIPSGRLADRIGRKKVLYITTPLFWVSSLLLIWAPNATFLIIAGSLQGFFFISAVIVGAMSRELVPPALMGRWTGIIQFYSLMIGAGAAFIGGAIWDSLGPEYIFLIAIGLDLFIKMPLLIKMPETLRMEEGRMVVKGQ